MRIRLIWKLLGVNVLVLIAVIGAVWFSIDLLASDYFMTLMKKFEIDAPEVNSMFLAANQRSLLQVGAVAIFVSGGLSFWMTRRMLAPLGQMTRSTEKIAEGDYDCAIEAKTNDEFADLARSFNEMSSSLAHNELLRGRMIVDVAHELRTPLTNLRGYVEALQDGMIEPSEVVFGTLHEELLRMVRLTEDLLQASRTGERAGRPRRRVSVVDLLDSCLELFRPRLERRWIEVKTEIDCDGVEVCVDADQVKQVFSNLLQNCLQFAPEDSWVKITGIKRDDSVRFVFSNPGEGIDDDDLQFIFEPYYRTDKSRSRDTGGAGIGLAIVKSMIEAHGGKVGASSCADATRVWIELPRSRSE